MTSFTDSGKNPSRALMLCIWHFARALMVKAAVFFLLLFVCFYRNIMARSLPPSLPLPPQRWSRPARAARLGRVLLQTPFDCESRRTQESGSKAGSDLPPPHCCYGDEHRFFPGISCKNSPPWPQKAPFTWDAERKHDVLGLSIDTRLALFFSTFDYTENIEWIFMTRGRVRCALWASSKLTEME